MNTQDFMEELMVMMLTEKKVNNIYKNEVSFWIDCGCERGLHYDIDCYDDLMNGILMLYEFLVIGMFLVVLIYMN